MSVGMLIPERGEEENYSRWVHVHYLMGDTQRPDNAGDLKGYVCIRACTLVIMYRKMEVPKKRKKIKIKN